MAEQQAFHPGVSLAGAVDLEALKHQVKAEPGQAGGAPAAGGYVIDTTENTFQAMVQTSATFPILLFLWVPTDDRLFAMARALGDAVNKLNGQIQLSRIDIASNPSIAQAFQIQGAPALFALIGGRPMPILQGLPSDEELQQRISDAKQRLGSKLLILGHFYQRDEIIKHADFVGDSFQLAKNATERPDADHIVFCGVHFMAETADILSTPEQSVTLPTCPPAARWPIWPTSTRSRNAGTSSARSAAPSRTPMACSRSFRSPT